MSNRKNIQAAPRTRPRFTSAHAMAAVSLFVALSMGGAWAAGIPKNSVRSKQIKDNAVVAKDVRDGALGGAEIADDSLTGADVDEATLSLPKPDPAPAPQPADTTPRGPAGGALAGEFPNPSLAEESVGAQEVEPDSIGTQHLETGAVNGADVSQDTLRADNLASSSVDTAEIASSAVEGAEIAPDAVDSDEVLDGGLNGDDVGRESGTVLFDTGGVIASEVCVTRSSSAGVPDDLGADSVAMSIGPGLGTQVIAAPTTSTTAGVLSLRICNIGDFNADPQDVTVHWVAFDV